MLTIFRFLEKILVRKWKIKNKMVEILKPVCSPRLRLKPSQVISIKYSSLLLKRNSNIFELLLLSSKAQRLLNGGCGWLDLNHGVRKKRMGGGTCRSQKDGEFSKMPTVAPLPAATLFSAATPFPAVNSLPSATPLPPAIPCLSSLYIPRFAPSTYTSI